MLAPFWTAGTRIQCQRPSGQVQSTDVCTFSCHHLSTVAYFQHWHHVCRRSTPTQQDGQWQHVPPRMRPFPLGVPASYPPGKHPTLDDPATYAKLDTEALFFAFYYQPGSYQQYLAAKELKRQSWRYHKGQRSWFQVRLSYLSYTPPILRHSACSLKLCKHQQMPTWRHRAAQLPGYP